MNKYIIESYKKNHGPVMYFVRGNIWSDDLNDAFLFTSRERCCKLIEDITRFPANKYAIFLITIIPCKTSEEIVEELVLL